MRGSPLPKKHVHIKTKHRKLRGPDWYISEMMLDRTIDAIYRRLPVNREYHVPYVAGYSTDCKQIYIDRDLPPSFVNKDGEVVEIDRYLLLHEAVEKSLIDTLNLRYQHAHQIALRAEQAAVRADGVSWHEYDRFMQKFVKEMGAHTVTDLPPDLDLKPYIDEHDTELLEQMRVLMKATRTRQRGASAKGSNTGKGKAKGKGKGRAVRTKRSRITAGGAQIAESAADAAAQAG